MLFYNFNILESEFMKLLFINLFPIFKIIYRLFFFILYLFINSYKQNFI